MQREPTPTPTSSWTDCLRGELHAYLHGSLLAVDIEVDREHPVTPAREKQAHLRAADLDRTSSVRALARGRERMKVVRVWAEVRREQPAVRRLERVGLERLRLGVRHREIDPAEAFRRRGRLHRACERTGVAAPEHEVGEPVEAVL